MLGSIRFLQGGQCCVCGSNCHLPYPTICDEAISQQNRTKSLFGCANTALVRCCYAAIALGLPSRCATGAMA